MGQYLERDVQLGQFFVFKQEKLQDVRMLIGITQ